MQAQVWPDDWRQSETEKQRTIIFTEFTFGTNRLMKPPEIHLQRQRHHVKVKKETSFVKYASNPKQDKAVLKLWKSTLIFSPTIWRWRWQAHNYSLDQLEGWH